MDERFVFKSVKITPNPVKTGQQFLISVDLEYNQKGFPFDFPFDFMKNVKNKVKKYWFGFPFDFKRKN